VRDYELYTGTALDRLVYFQRRSQFQQAAVKHLNAGTGTFSTPPGIVDPSLYGIAGHARNGAMQRLIDDQPDEIFFVRIAMGMPAYEILAASLASLQDRLLPIPELPKGVP